MTLPPDPRSSAGDAPAFSRDELLGGMPSRRAQTVLFAIEGRAARLAERSRQAMATYLTPQAEAERERAFLAALADARDQRPVRAQQLERFASQWAGLVPRDAASTAYVAAAIGQKYDFRRADVPGLVAALRLDDADVRTAFEDRLGRPIASIFSSEVPPLERLRWWWSRIGARLESLPPFWTAFSLTFTELFGAGIVALPIAVVAVGPWGAIALLLAFGLLNMLTVAGLAEAITRSGTMRFGSTYFGRFVGAYLGRSGSVAATVVLAVFNLIAVGVYIFGFATTVGGSTGLPAGLWAIVLAVVVLFILRRQSLDATVASVLVIGLINIGALMAIAVIALGAFDTANFTLTADGDATAASAVGLVFGTMLMAFQGHSSAGNAAKVVLARDPGGRSLITGNLAAMGTSIVFYALFVIVTLGAVPADELAGFSGTALVPLAEATGPLVAFFGIIFVSLSIGGSALHASLGLFNQVGEWLPRVGTSTRSRARALLDDARVRVAVRASPVIIILLVVEWLIVSDSGSFTDIVSFTGVIVLPFIAGVFPMTLLLATRRRGEYVPEARLGAGGSPIVVGAVCAFFVGTLVLYGLVIWENPLERAAALVAAAALLAVIWAAIREDRFRPRLVAEVRVDTGRPAAASLSVVAAGVRADAPIAWRGRDADDGRATGAVRISPADDIRSVTIGLPEDAPRDVRVWMHRIDDEGDSLAWPATVTLDGASSAEALPLDEHGIADIEIATGATDVTIVPPADGGGAGHG